MLWPPTQAHASCTSIEMRHTHTYTCSNSTEPSKTGQGTKDKGLQTNCAAAISRSKQPQDTCTKASNNKHEHRGTKDTSQNKEPTARANQQSNRPGKRDNSTFHVRLTPTRDKTKQQPRRDESCNDPTLVVSRLYGPSPVVSPLRWLKISQENLDKIIKTQPENLNN